MGIAALLPGEPFLLFYCSEFSYDTVRLYCELAREWSLSAAAALRDLTMNDVFAAFFFFLLFLPLLMGAASTGTVIGLAGRLSPPIC